MNGTMSFLARNHFLPLNKSILSMVLIAATCISFSGCSKSNRNETEASGEHEGKGNNVLLNNRQPKNNLREKNSKQKQPEKAQDDDKFQNELLENIIDNWNQDIAEFKGEELLRKQREIERRAASLGPGKALLKFFEFLKNKGANDTRERVIGEIGNAVFAREHAVEARKWLLTVEDKELREKLCRFAGKYHPKEGIKEYIDAFAPDTKCQSAVLTGYCMNLTKTDPSGAVKAFTDLIPSTVTFEGLVEVMAVLPPQSDFAAISSSLPGDTKNIAKRARAALLQSWTAAKPEDAAQYVIANTTLASPEQMGVVAFNWCKQSPEAAARWIDALSQGPIKDEGTAALAKYWSSPDPQKAWEFASKVGDPTKRVAAATGVFKEWEKTDREAATKAWTALFPPANQ